MKSRSTALTVGGVVAVLAVGAATAFAAITYKVQTAPYNPGNHAITVAAKWVDGAGEPGGSNKQGVLLALSYTDIYPPGTSADATVNKMCTATNATTHACTAGTSLTSLGFDRLVSGYCTASGPRWDIETLDGGVYNLGCSDGTHTANSGFQAGWERVEYNAGNSPTWAYQSGPASGCSFSVNTGGCSVVFLQLLLDEGPSIALLDNFVVNGQVIGNG